MLCTSKESLEHVEFRFRMKRYDFLEKPTNFEIFSILIQRGTPLLNIEVTPEGDVKGVKDWTLVTREE